MECTVFQELAGSGDALAFRTTGGPWRRFAYPARLIWSGLQNLAPKDETNRDFEQTREKVRRSLFLPLLAQALVLQCVVGRGESVFAVEYVDDECDSQ